MIIDQKRRRLLIFLMNPLPKPIPADGKWEEGPGMVMVQGEPNEHGLSLHVFNRNKAPFTGVGRVVSVVPHDEEMTFRNDLFILIKVGPLIKLHQVLDGI